MGGNKYSSALNQRIEKSRLGCTVCVKKNANDTLVNHIEHVEMSSNKPWLDRNHLKNKFTSTKNEKSTTPYKPSVNECYCNHMEQLKNEPFPRLICSKLFKTPNLINVDKNWLHEIIEFRRENWFDCHSDSFIDTMHVQNNKAFYISNKHSLNSCHLNDFKCSNPFNISNLKTENICTGFSTFAKIGSYTNVEKKTSEKKNDWKKKKNTKKPWIPSSVNFKL